GWPPPWRGGRGRAGGGWRCPARGAPGGFARTRGAGGSTGAWTPTGKAGAPRRGGRTPTRRRSPRPRPGGRNPGETPRRAPPLPAGPRREETRRTVDGPGPKSISRAARPRPLQDVGAVRLASLGPDQRLGSRREPLLV